jgi:hypothetical protein
LPGIERQLNTEHCGQANPASRFSKSDHPVETTVVGESHGFEAEPGCFDRKIFRARCAVEKAEVRMGMEFCVWLDGRGRSRTNRLVGRSER